MQNEIKPGDPVNVKLGESVLGHTVVNVGSTHAIVRRGEVSRRVPLEDISAPTKISGDAVQENAPATNAAAPASEVANAGIGSLTQSIIELREKITALEKSDGENRGAIGQLLAGVEDLGSRVTALETKPARVAEVVPPAPSEAAAVDPFAQNGDAAKS